MRRSSKEMKSCKIRCIKKVRESGKIEWDDKWCKGIARKGAML